MYEALIKELEFKAGFEYFDDNVYNRAIDAIRNLETKNNKLKELATIPTGKTVYGYPLQELVLFAGLCRQEDITDDELHDFCTNVSRYYEALRKHICSEIESSMGTTVFWE